MEKSIRKRTWHIRIVAVPLTLFVLIFLGGTSASAFKANMSRSSHVSSIQQGTANQRPIKGDNQNMNMIRVQSTVSQRQQAVQQATQMMNSLNQSLMGSGGHNCVLCNIK